jgi:hypothetical protein
MNSTSSTSSNNSSSNHVSFADLKRRILQHQREQQHLSKQQRRQHQVGGPAGPLQPLLGLAGEMQKLCLILKTRKVKARRFFSLVCVDRIEF